MARKSVMRANAGAGDVTFNMTPMIDCTFQLIIFFILTSQAASLELAKLTLSKPYKSTAVTSEEFAIPYKAIVNITSAEGENGGRKGEAMWYVVGGKKVRLQDLHEVQKFIGDRLASHLKDGLAQKDFYVEIRGDKRVHFRHILPVMEIATNLGIGKMNLSAQIKTVEE